MDFVATNLSSADFESGSGPGNDTSFIFFNCRTSELSHDSVTSPLFWSIFYQIQDSTPYVATIEAVFFLIAFFWNFFILLSLLSNPIILKEQPASIYLLNIALVDIIHSVTVILISMVSEAAQEFIFGNSDFVRCHLCEFLGFMLMLLVTCSLHTLAALSVDRFILLARPLRYKHYFNWKRAALVVVGCWIVGVLVAFPPLAGFGQYEFNIVFANCHPRWTGESNGIPHINYVLYAGVEAVVPIVILTVTNVWTFKIVSRALRQRFKRQKSFRDAPKSDEERQRDLEESRDYKHKQRQLVKVFGALLIGHIVSWTPTLSVMVVAAIIGATSVPLGVYVFGWISYLSNPVLHPIIESFFIKDLRQKVTRARRRVRTSLKTASTSVMSRTPSILSRTWSSRSLMRRSSSKKFSDISDSPQVNKRAFEHCNSNRLSPILKHRDVPKSIQLSNNALVPNGNSPLMTPMSTTTVVTPLDTSGFPAPIVMETPKIELVDFEPAGVPQTPLSKENDLHVTFREDSETNCCTHQDSDLSIKGSDLTSKYSDHQNEIQGIADILTAPESHSVITKASNNSSRSDLQESGDSGDKIEPESTPYTVTPI